MPLGEPSRILEFSDVELTQGYLEPTSHFIYHKANRTENIGPDSDSFHQTSVADYHHFPRPPPATSYSLRE